MKLLVMHFSPVSSSVPPVIGLEDRVTVIQYLKEAKDISLLSNRPDRLCPPPPLPLLFNVCRGPFFLEGKVAAV